MVCFGKPSFLAFRYLLLLASNQLLSCSKKRVFSRSASQPLILACVKVRIFEDVKGFLQNNLDYLARICVHNLPTIASWVKLGGRLAEKERTIRFETSHLYRVGGPSARFGTFEFILPASCPPSEKIPSSRLA